MRSVRSRGLGVLAADALAAVSLTCAPSAVAYDTVEEEYLDMILEFSDTFYFWEDDPALLRLGYTACEKSAVGVPEELIVKGILHNSDLAVNGHDAQLIYDMATEHLC